MVFDDVIGQTHVSTTLRNALASGRLAHAFIFTGTRGCGKTTTARILARAVNCLAPKNFEPCNECEVCREIIDGRSMDVIEIDGASNRGVEEIRNLRESVRYTPTRGAKKVYIIDEVHMLTKEAFNALLKTLEEPPPHVLFIFATTEIHKVPATILSRCQRYDFRRISVDEIMGRLRFIAGAEGIVIDEDSLLMIAKKGDGSMRDAQSIFDQVISFCGMTIAAQQVAEALSIVDAELYFRVSDAVAARDTRGGLALVDDVVHTGYDLKEFLGGLSEHLRNLLIVKTTGDARLIEETEQTRTRYKETAEKFTVHDLLRLIHTVTDLESDIRYSVQPRFKVEIAIVQMTKMDDSVKIDELLAQIDALKKKLKSGQSLTSAPAHAGTAPASAGPTERDAPVRAAAPAAERKHMYSVSVSTAAAPSAPRVSEPSRTQPLASAQEPGVSIGDVNERWSGFIEEVMKERINIGSIVAKCLPLEIVDGSLRLSCPDQLCASTLLQYKEYLAPRLNAFFSSRLSYEPVVRMTSGTTAPSQDAPAVRSTTRSAAEMENPIVKILFRDFEADPL
jgi:DNA polymerase-3 subunit gamma/tau